METETGLPGTEVPEGEWRSLSAELLRTLYPAL
jgi:hypothetical protein